MMIRQSIRAIPNGTSGSPSVISAGFVPEAPQQVLAFGDVQLTFDARRFDSVDDAEDPASQLRLRHHDVDRIGGGAVDMTYLGHRLDRAQHVDRKGVAQQYEKGVSGTELEHCFAGLGGEIVVGAAPAYERLSRRLRKCQPEADSWHRTYQGFVQVFNALDEMALSEDQIDAFAGTDRHHMQFHRLCPHNILPSREILSGFTFAPSARTRPPLSCSSSSPASTPDCGGGIHGASPEGAAECETLHPHPTSHLRPCSLGAEEPIVAGSCAAVQWWASWVEGGVPVSMASVTILRFDEWPCGRSPWLLEPG